MGAAPVDKAGVASGVLNTFRQVGVALGIAIMGAIITNRDDGSRAPAPTSPHAFVHGLTFGMRQRRDLLWRCARVRQALIQRNYRHAELAQPLAEAALNAT